MAVRQAASSLFVLVFVGAILSAPAAANSDDRTVDSTLSATKPKKNSGRLRVSLPRRIETGAAGRLHVNVWVPDRRPGNGRFSFRCRPASGGKLVTWVKGRQTDPALRGWFGDARVRAGDWRCRAYFTSKQWRATPSRVIRVIGHADPGAPATRDISDDGTRALVMHDAPDSSATNVKAYLDVIAVPSGQTLWSTLITSSADQGLPYMSDLSPDGTKVAFWSTTSSLPDPSDNPAPDLYVKNLATGSLERVQTGDWGTTGNNQRGGSPHFTPDSARLIFQANEYNHYVYDFLSGSLKQILSGWACDSGVHLGPGNTWFAEENHGVKLLVDQVSGETVRQYNLDKGVILLGDQIPGRFAFFERDEFLEASELDRLDLDTGQLETVLQGRESSPFFSASNTPWLLTYSQVSKTIRVWNKLTGQLERTVSSVVWPKGFYPDGWADNAGFAKLTPDGRWLIILGTVESEAHSVETSMIVKVDTTTGMVTVVARDVAAGNGSLPLLANNSVFFYHRWSTPTMKAL